MFFPLKLSLIDFYLFLQLKKSYESTCKELEQIDVRVNTAKNAAVTTLGTKDFEKV